MARPVPAGWRSLTSRGLGAALVVITASCGTAATVSQEPATHHEEHSDPTASSHLALLRPLAAEQLDLRAPAVDMPLRLEIPALELRAPVMGVGLTSADVMDAPFGGPEDPVWRKVFWYRGGGVPGDPGTATLAGHVSGGRGPSVFADLQNLEKGDTIVVVDTRDGTEIRFAVTKRRIYSMEESEDPAVLERVYGEGPVAGTGPIPSGNGRSRLILITCAGSLVDGSYDQRMVVFAVRNG